MDQQQAAELARTLHLAGGIVGAGVGVFGGLIGYLAPRGKARGLVMGGMFAVMALGAVAFIAGIVLAFRGVPFIVYWPALLIGFILSVVMAPMAPLVRMRYRQAENRRIEAAALRGS